ncbi:MAG: hypothetical protein E6R03_02345 [Hyphomicrobiaceae bacterium]|nr:MAG: hypothetical protein E6R03_02345 [Hyphomicrobiaceae bacterium]
MNNPLDTEQPDELSEHPEQLPTQASVEASSATEGQPTASDQIQHSPQQLAAVAQGSPSSSTGASQPPTQAPLVYPDSNIGKQTTRSQQSVQGVLQKAVLDQQDLRQEIEDASNLQSQTVEKRRDAYREQFQKRMATLTQATDKLETLSVDPNRFFKNQSTFGKIATAIGYFLSPVSGVATVLTQRLVDNAVRADIDEQKAAVQKQGEVVKGRLNELDELRQFVGDERLFDELQYNAYYKKVESILDTYQKQFGGVETQAKYMQAKAMFQQASQVRQTVIQQRVGQLASYDLAQQGRGLPAQFALGLPEDERKRLVKLPGKQEFSMALTESGAKDLQDRAPAYERIESGLNQLEKLADNIGVGTKAGALVGFPTQIGAVAEAIKSDLTLAIKDKDKGGALDKGLQELVNQLLGNPFTINTGAFKSRIAAYKERVGKERESLFENSIPGYRNPSRSVGDPIRIGKK